MRRSMPPELPDALLAQDWKPISSYVERNSAGRQSNKVSARNPALVDLDVEWHELVQTWKTFARYLPPEDQIEWEERPQTVQDVQALVRNIQSFWMNCPRQRIFSRSMTLCDRFLPTIEIHAALLTVLPGSETYYAPLFYGTLQTVLKVSVKAYKIWKQPDRD